MTAETTNRKELCSDLAELCQGRANTYAFLARLFLKEVDEQTFVDLKSMRFPASTGNKHMDQGYRLMAMYLANTWENSLQELAVDYVRTFIGSGVDSFSAAYPIESVYTSEKRLTMQSSRDEVLAIYRAYGLEKSASWKEGEDHIACELEFLSALSSKAATAFSEARYEDGISYLVAQRNFLNDHVVLWAPMLAFGMTKFAKTDFYAGLSALLKGFLEIDREFLEDVASCHEAE